MKAALVTMVAAALTGLVVAAYASAATSVSGTFVTHFGRSVGASNDPCRPDTFCGTGTLSGYGAGTKITDFVSFEPIEGTACADVEVVQEITVEAGTLVLVGEGTFCSPGASDAAHFSDRAYGRQRQRRRGSLKRRHGKQGKWA